MAEFATDTYPVPEDPTIQDILQAVERVLRKPVQTIVIQAGKPIVVTWEKNPGDRLDDEDIRWKADEVLAHVPVEEMGDGLSPHEHLFHALLRLQQERLEPVCLYIGQGTNIRQAFGIPSSLPLGNRLLGIVVEITSSLPAGTVVLAGAPSRLSPTSDIGMLLLFHAEPTKGSSP